MRTSGSFISSAVLLLCSVGVALMVAGCGGAGSPTGSFALSVTPSALSVQAGASGAIQVIANPANGFHQTVTVAATGLPAGVTSSPATLTLTPGVAQTLTLTAASSAAAGTATVTLTGSASGSGSSGGSTQSSSVAFTITSAPLPDFALSLAPSSTSLTAGGPGLPVALLATPANGFTGAVSVSVSGLPTGVTASPATLNLAPGTTQSVVLTAAAAAAVGTANVTFTGISGGLSHTTALAVAVISAPVAVNNGPDVTTYHVDNTREGLNAQETKLTLANVNAANFGLLGNYTLDGVVDAAPLYVGGLRFGGAGAGHVANVIFVATEHDSVYALDVPSGTQEWKTSVLGAGETTSDPRSCNQITPEIGITSTPVIDRGYGAHGAIFVVAMTKDGNGAYHQRLHALDLTTGAELAGSPTEITASYPGTGESSQNGVVPFLPGQYAERVGLLLLNGTIYTGWTSHCDIEPYTGWVMGYSEATLKQTAVLNLTPNGSEGSIWMSGYGLAADTSGNIYFLDANGTLDNAFTSAGYPSGSDFGNAIVKLSTAGGTLAVSDYFEPYNTYAESASDVDLGAGGAMLLPDLADNAGMVHHLLVGGGKDGNLYVANRDNLGKFNPANNMNLYQELPSTLPSGVWAGPAYFNNTVFYGGVGDVLKAYTITDAMLSATPTSVSATSFGYPGTTPSVSSNGRQNGIVWALQSGTSSPAVLHAYDAGNLAHELYNSGQAANGRDAFGNGNKFVTPVVSNGMVFVGTPHGVAVFGLLGP